MVRRIIMCASLLLSHAWAHALRVLMQTCEASIRLAGTSLPPSHRVKYVEIGTCTVTMARLFLLESTF
jgi:hypothetical protein